MPAFAPQEGLEDEREKKGEQEPGVRAYPPNYGWAKD